MKILEMEVILCAHKFRKFNPWRRKRRRFFFFSPSLEKKF